jgi:hypothetical protein
VLLDGTSLPHPIIGLSARFLAEQLHAASRFLNRFGRVSVACGMVLLGFSTTALSQKASQDSAVLPKYDLQTETKTKGIVDEVNILPLGSKKDLRELIIASGSDKIHIYVCPRIFEEEMGISFSKGDEIAVTGSKVKLEELDVILARELVKGSDTLVFRDGKGIPVWDPRTEK